MALFSPDFWATPLPGASLVQAAEAVIDRIFRSSIATRPQLCARPRARTWARCGFCRNVFLAPYWEAIFAQDAERKQDREEAEATGRVMAETYTRLGYEVVELPLAGVQELADFIANSLKTL